MFYLTKQESLLLLNIKLVWLNMWFFYILSYISKFYWFKRKWGLIVLYKRHQVKDIIVWGGGREDGNMRYYFTVMRNRRFCISFFFNYIVACQRFNLFRILNSRLKLKEFSKHSFRVFKRQSLSCSQIHKVSSNKLFSRF